MRDLERMLSRIPAHPSPRADLEQYATPASLAAPLLQEALALGDILDRRVVDLGCGTGIFALGAVLLGAREVEGVDIDASSLDVGKAESTRLAADVTWTVSDISAWRGTADTVIMNPPFGAQVRGADRAFLDGAFATAPVVYTLHNAGTREFVEKYAAKSGYASTHAWRMIFPLRHQFRHQEKAIHEIEVVALRLQKNG